MPWTGGHSELSKWLLCPLQEEGGKGQVKSRPEEEAATWARVEESLLHRGADWLGGEFELAQTGVGWDVGRESLLQVRGLTVVT